jgi:hypothetical protein
MNKTFLFAILLVSSIFAIPLQTVGQDTIMMKNSLIITGTISEIRSDSVFLLRNSSEKPIGIALSNVSSMKLHKILMAGKPEKATNPKNPYDVSAQRDSLPNYRRIIKATTFAPAFGHFGLGVEKELMNGFNHTSVEAMLGGIFLDKNYSEIVNFDSDVYGGYLRVGFRWYFPPTKKSPSSHQRLMGSYIGMMNTLTFFQFREEYYESVYYNYYYLYTLNYSRYIHVAKYSAEFIVGTQFPLSNRLLFNYYAGLGLSFTRITSSDDYQPYIENIHFTNLTFGIFSFSTGALLGYRF